MQLQADLERTKAKLESGDDAQLADLTKQDLVGDMLEATIFSYIAMNNIQDDIAAQQAGIVNYRAPSYGKFPPAFLPVTFLANREMSVPVA